MAHADAWNGIQRHGLLSTSALLDLFAIDGERRRDLESRHHRQSEVIEHAEYGRAVIRDQKPMSEAALRQCLRGMSAEMWYECLSRKVFFWLTAERPVLRALAAEDLHSTVLRLSFVGHVGQELQPAESQQPGSGVAIALGNTLDAVPEAMVLGIALWDRVVPLALVIAFSVGNFPVALSSTAGMRAAGRSYTYIFLLWSAIAIGAAAAIAAGYVGFGSLSEAWPPRLRAFGAGALLAMTAETMIPEAFHNSPRFSGLLAAFGFGVLLLVDVTTR